MRQEKPHASFVRGVPVPTSLPKRGKWRRQKPHHTFLPQGARYSQEAHMSSRFQQGTLVSVGEQKRGKWRQQNPQASFPEGAWFLQGAPMPACSQQERKWNQQKLKVTVPTRAPQGEAMAKRKVEAVELRQSRTLALYPQGEQKAPMPAGSQKKRKWKEQKPQTSFPQGAKFPQGAPMPAGSQQERKWSQQKLQVTIPTQREAMAQRKVEAVELRQSRPQASYPQEAQKAPMPAGSHKKRKWNQQKPQSFFAQGAPIVVRIQRKHEILAPVKRESPQGAPMTSRTPQKEPVAVGSPQGAPVPSTSSEKAQTSFGTHRREPVRELVQTSILHEAPKPIFLPQVALTPASFQQEQSSQSSRKRPCLWHMEDSDDEGLFQPPPLKKRRVELESRASPNSHLTRKRSCPWSTGPLEAPMPASSPQRATLPVGDPQGAPKHTFFQHGAPHAALSPEVGPKPAVFQRAAVPTSLPQATTLPASFPQRAPTSAPQQKSSQCSRKRPRPWSTKDLDNDADQPPPCKKRCMPVK
ncbi:pollen-specific leucine-rich repeat extensin 2 [Labeo rohita]|uniref:Pollen-specific leucine-rich repeat extensin 2 n=1 Tax=Labeo rohita TaxID=84645 RepID=A0A498LY17_LABRO|nr:pollen-specific leucine-rich repeat extensin 2 [Labeo rohita]